MTVLLRQPGRPWQNTRTTARRDGVGRELPGGVFLAYAGAQGYTLLDAELHLPEGWTSEPARLQAVGLAPDTPFATKP